jgi:hypothetical protein
MTMIPDDQGHSTPKPDPTLLTTEQLLREISRLETLVGMQIRAVDERLAAEVKLTGARFDAVSQSFDGMREMLNERYATQTKALDAALLAQQVATTTAFAAAEKAVQAALLAAEKAVDKANTASEKRFEAVNEFRGQLSDVMAGMISRVEADARFSALDNRLIDMKSTLDKGFSATDTGERKGREFWGYIIGAIGLLAVIGTLALQLVHVH